MDPPRSDIWWNFWKFYFSMYSPMIHANLKSAFLPIGWGPFEDVNLLYFLLKMQIWNGCNVLNIAGISIKDININLSFLSSRWKVVEWTPLGLENVLNAFLSSGSKFVEWTPRDLTSGGIFRNSTFLRMVQWYMQICHNTFFPLAEGILRC